MAMYLGKGRKCATSAMTATCARIDHMGHKLYMDNSFSPPALFDNSHTKTIYCCRTVRPNRKGMLKNFVHSMKMKKGKLKTKVKGNTTDIVRKDKQNVNILMNMHCPPLDGNFCDEHGKAVKPAIIQDYSRHMGYVDKSDHMILLLY